MKIAHRTDVGKVRERAEDSIVVLRMDFAYGSPHRERAFIVLGDGVGGTPSGEVASFLATKMLAEYMLPTLLSWAERIDYLPLLQEGVKDTNRRVLEYSVRNPQHAGMGTTLLAAVIDGRMVYVMNVGDSRFYTLNKSGMKQVSVDHRDSSGALTRAVGCFPEVEADVFRIELKPKDRMLICCDGLTDQVPEKKIAETIRSGKDLQAACGLLIDAANEAGGVDNVSVVIAEVP
jgi:PPM family protein phosphatase